MEKMGVLDLAKECYRELSGGQRQRTLLARALCAAKKVLFLDEPASGIDAAGAADMYDLLIGMNADGMTVVMITHDIGPTVPFATHILQLGLGQTGPTGGFFTKEEYMGLNR